MEEIKQQRFSRVIDDNKLIIDENSLSGESITYFEDLSNEIIYEIFDYLDFCHVYDAFSNLNTRFENLFNDPMLSIKIELSSVSKSTLQRYYTEILIPNRNRIKALHLSYSFIIDRIFSPVSILLQLLRLEKLTLDKIDLILLQELVNSFIFLPCLISLIVIAMKCEYDVIDNNMLLCQIFRLPVLKYCKLSIEGLYISDELSIAVNDFSSIEYLVITNGSCCSNIDILLTYVPQLRHLSVDCLEISFNNLIESSLTTLNYLTHVSLTIKNLPFTELELLIEKVFNRVEVFHLSNENELTYFDANRWQRMILSHMSYLKVLDIFISYNLRYNSNLDEYITSINQFNSSFWSERKWFFQYQIYEEFDGFQEYEGQTIIFYSINPYRRKYYTFYYETLKKSGSHNLERDLCSVDHVKIQDDRAIDDFKHYFPDATQVSIWYNYNHETKTFGWIDLNNIIPLQRLNKLIFSSHSAYLTAIVNLLQFMPNIHTFEISFESIRDTDLISIKETNAFRLVSQTNNIRNIIIDGRYTLKLIKFLIKLSPRLYQLSISKMENDFQLVLQLILSYIDNEKLNYLFLLNITNVYEDEADILTFIKSDKLLNHRSLQLKYFRMHCNVYLWW